MVDYRFRTEKIGSYPLPYQGGQVGGQRVIDKGMKNKRLVFGWELDHTSAGALAFDKWEHLEDIWEFEDQIYGYQRRIDYDDPNEDPQTLYGKIESIKTTITFGREETIFGDLTFVIDDNPKEADVPLGTTAPPTLSGSILSAEILTDGTDTVTFTNFNSVAIQLMTNGLIIIPKLLGAGQEVVDIGKKEKLYTFNFTLMDDSPPTITAYDKLRTMETIWVTDRNEYQRKVQFARPRSGIGKTVYGKIGNILAPTFRGEDWQKIEGDLDILIDNDPVLAF